MERPLETAEVRRRADARYEIITRIPNWMRAADMLAELLVWVILGAGFFSFGYVTDPAARAIAFVGCGLLGIWAAIGLIWGRWTNPHKRPAAWFLVLLGAFILWTGIQLIPLPSGLVTSLSPTWAMVKESYAATGLEFPDKIPLAHSPARGLASWYQLIASTCFFAGVSLLASRRGPSIRLVVAVSAVVLIEGFLGIHTYVFRNAGRAYGGVYNPNHHATLIMMGFQLYLAGLVVWGRFSPRFQGSAFSGSNPLLFFYAAGLLALLGWLASISRGAVIIGAAVLVAWIAIEVVAFYKEEIGADALPVAIRSGSVLIIGAIAVGLVGFLLYEAASLPAGVVRREWDAAGLLQHGQGRMALWKATLEALWECPWTGLGLAGTEPALNRFSLIPTVKTPIWSHNDYVQVLAELGIPAFLGMLVLLALGIRSFIREWKFRRATFTWSERILSRAAAAGLVMVLLHSVTEFHLRIPLIGFVFLILLALVLNPGVLMITSMRPRH